MNKIFVSISLLPNQEINSSVLLLNKELGKKFKLHKINDIDFAHISLYNATFPECNRRLIESSLPEIFKNTQQIEVKPESIHIKSRFVSVVFEKTEVLINLQDRVIEALNPLREGLLQSKYTEKSEFYSQEELVNAHTYGYPFCKDQFSPHMTVAELENIDDATKIIKEVFWEKIIILDKISIRVLFTNDIGEKIKEVIYLKLQNK